MTSIWIQPMTVQELNALTQNTLSDHLGIVFTEIGASHLVAQMPIKSIHLQPMGFMHGGATAVLAETIGNIAANHCVEVGKTCVGLELNINHLKAVKEGFVEAIAVPLHLGRTTQVWEIKIYNIQKALTSAARLTVSVIEKKHRCNK